VNDLSRELIALYKAVKAGDPKFFEVINVFNDKRTILDSLVQDVGIDQLLDVYSKHFEFSEDKTMLRGVVNTWVSPIREKLHELSYSGKAPERIVHEVELNIFRKLLRMKQLEVENGNSLHIDIFPNIVTALHSAFYMYVRHLYNHAHDLYLESGEFTAAFYYLREFCYSSMFRFNQLGEFNVPYGGMAYNQKNFAKKIADLLELQRELSSVRLHNQDFEDFLRRVKPGKNDFLFLDPPYDSEFSEYDGNKFGKADHQRLAGILSTTKASFLLVIKNTTFVRDLYGKIEGVETRVFNKQYAVSFQNRNDQKAMHLVFTNYASSYAFQ